LNNDWIGKTAVVAFFLICASLISLEIYDNKPSKQQQIEYQTGQSQPQNEGSEKTPIGYLSSPTEFGHEGHDDSHTRQAHNGSDDEPSKYLIFGDGWAQWAMVIASFGALGVSVWAVCLLSATLKATRHTIRLGLRSNKAARDAVTVAQNIGISQVQAYVAFTSAKVIEKTDEIVLEGWVKNAGHSTARKAVVQGRVDAFDPQTKAHINYWIFDKQDLGSILPTAKLNLKMPIPKNTFGPMKNGTSVYFAISITYVNIFGHTLMEPLPIKFKYPNFKVVTMFNEKEQQS